MGPMDWKESLACQGATVNEGCLDQQDQRESLEFKDYPVSLVKRETEATRVMLVQKELKELEVSQEKMVHQV